MGFEDVGTAVKTLLDICAALVEFSENCILLINLGVDRVSHLLQLWLLVHILDAVLADAYSLVVGILRDLDEEFRAAAADTNSTLSTVMKSCQETKFSHADVALSNIVFNPVRPLCDLEILNPLKECILSNETLLELCEAALQSLINVDASAGDRSLTWTGG